MEQWETLIRGFPSPADLRCFAKVVESASVVLKEDLAPFEIDLIIETLLFNPVNLLSTVSSKRNDDSWSKVTADSFKLLSEVVTEQHYENIVQLCNLTYEDSIVRQQALKCLTNVARRSATGTQQVERHIASLEIMTTCRAPLCLLIGVICEHHPDVIMDQMTNVWRIYLNLLDSNKNSDTVISAALQGLAGLFKHFGSDLPTCEMNDFFDKMVDQYIVKSKCQDACFTIIKNYAALFKERIAVSTLVREILWDALSDGKNAAGTIRSAYRAVGDIVDRDGALKIINTELLQHTQSYMTQIKYTALRVLTDLQTTFGISSSDDSIDVQYLEFELRTCNVSYDTAEAVSWCIESKVANSDKLLQTAILFYDNLPSAKRKEIVVHGLLNAETDVRTESIKFLINESCQESAIDKYLTLWKDIFDTNKGIDNIVIEKSRAVFEEFMGYTIFVLDTFLEEDLEKIPDRLTNLLHLSHHVITQQPKEDYTNDYSCVLVHSLVQLICKYGGSAAAMAASRAACEHLCEVPVELYELIQIDRCRDEALLCESCLVLIDAPDAFQDNVLTALQIIFSRNDVEPKMLSKSLHKLESLILSQKALDGDRVSDVIHLVAKLRERTNMTGKDARILHRDVLMFLGKYGNKTDVNNNTEKENIIVKLKETLTLTVPNPFEGSTYKINLQRILHLAIVNEEPNALQVLLVILFANLANRKDEHHQLALTLVVHALSRSHARGNSVDTDALQQAVLECDGLLCVQAFLQYISSETSPGVRRMLSDALERLLVRPGSEELVTATAEHAADMLASDMPTTKRAGLNITETLIVALKENNNLTTRFLPNILTLISKTDEIDSETTFELASKLFMEKIELFDENDVEILEKDLLKTLLVKKSKMAAMDVRVVRKTNKMCLGFIKNIFDYKKDELSKILELFFSIFQNQNGGEQFFVLAEMRKIFDLNIDLCRNVLSYNDFCVLNTLFCMEFGDDCCMEGVLKFLEEYSEVLLELRYQETLELLSNIITEIKPKSVKTLHRNLKSCLSIYEKILKKTPTKFLSSFENWCQKLPLKEITVSIDKESFLTEHAVSISALKIMLNIFNLTDPSILTDVNVNAQKWPRTLLKLFSKGFIENYLKSQMSYLTDLLTISVRFVKVTDVKRLILEGHNLHGVSNERVGIKFCRLFMNVFYEKFLERPFFLLDEDLGACCIVLNDVIKYVVKKKCTDDQYDNALALVNELWPLYENQATFNQKHSLLLDLSSLSKKLQPTSNPMQWAMRVVSEGSTEEKARIIGVLPGGEAYSATYRQFTATLSTRLSEQRAPFRALLDALSTNRDALLFDIVMRLCSGDDTKGWWDDAIESCIASIAQHSDEELCKAAYTRCWDGLSLAVCRRVLVPLLRYSTTSFSERFLSTVLKDILYKLSRQHSAPSMHYSYRKHIVDYITCFTILMMAFEKIPPSSIESPNSVLYKELETQKSWHLSREVGRLSVTLRDKVVCPETADDETKNNYRLFQCANYNCLSAAICCWKPQAKIYECIFNVDVWRKMVDCDVVYQLKLRSQWNQKTKSHPVSIDVSTDGGGGLSCRTMQFLRTLSEDALMYDLIDCGSAELVTTQDIQLQENELNGHECSLTLTAVLCHCSCLAHTRWRDTLCTALTGDLHCNVKFILAQAICNSKEKLKAHASELTPALLALICDTVRVENGKKLLNALHVDVLETVTYWNSLTPSAHLNSVVEHLISTCLINRERLNIFKSLLDALGKILNLCSDVYIGWSVFEPYVEERTTEATKSLLKILKLISKSKIHIPELLPTLLVKIETKQGQAVTLSESFGLALTACQDDGLKREALTKFRAILKKTGDSDFVKMLHYAQSEFRGCCDENCFRKITDLTTKLVGPAKQKCLQIISSYIQTNTGAYIQDMFETAELCELLTSHNAGDAMGVARDGLQHMGDGLKRRVVMLVAGYCGHSLAKMRKGAMEVMIKAFAELYEPKTQPAKRPRTSISTPILKALETIDVYTTTILSSLGLGCIDEDVGAFVRGEISGYLDKDMAVRFTECFILTICLPSHKRSGDGNVSALLDLLLSNLISQERFLKARLRDEPLETRESTSGPSKLLTLSKTYQGSLRGYSSLSGRRKQATKSQGIDVQMTIDSILNTFLQFAKSTPEAAQALCVQLVKCLRGSPGFEFSRIIAEQLNVVLNKAPNDNTPFVIELARHFIEDCCLVPGFEQTITKLKNLTKSTEGQHMVRLLGEEVLTRCHGDRLFVRACSAGREDGSDVAMDELYLFCIEDLTAMFGKLSNWDELTTREKRKIKDSGLPPLWTDEQTFKTCLDDYTVTEGWFGKLISAYRHTDKQNAMQWLREFDIWPRRHFNISAVTEAIEWQSREGDQNKLPCEILPSDCLAEWAARLMIRKAYLRTLETDSEQAVDKLSRSHELSWCESANEKELSTLVLGCIKRNIPNLHNMSETLPWLRQKVLALRAMGLERNDSALLQKALNTAEKDAPQFVKYSTIEERNEINKLTLLLNQDLKSLSTDKIENVLRDVDRQNVNGVMVTQKNRQTLHSIYEIAMTHYDDLFENCSGMGQRDSLLSNMSNILERAISVDRSKSHQLVAIIINRLDDCDGVLDDDTAASLLDKIATIAPDLDDCFLHQLKRNSKVFPSRLLAGYTFMSDRDDTMKYKQCLQLVCDPEHTLLHYCDALKNALVAGDIKEWKEVFCRMREKMFDNPYAGSDYQLLTKYKNSLYEIRDFELSESYKDKTKKILDDIIRELRRKTPRSTLLLSQLCPELCSAVHTSLCRIMALPTASAITFEQRVQVFTDSVRRPVVLKVRESTGRGRRYLHKCGEPLRRDHGAVAVLRHSGVGGTVYQVTMTSEDSALIEFLEDHERLRSLIATSCDLSAPLDSVGRQADHELILAPTQALVQQHYQLCEKVPRHALRSAIERNSASVQDFIAKKNNFQDSISSMTVMNWILGLDDRHLQNIMYSCTSGRACCVDWGALLLYGRTQVTVARLTDNVLAVCDTAVLESQLQSTLKSLRLSRRMFLAVVKIAFKWMGTEFDDKYAYIKSILEGRALSYHITRDVFEKSSTTKYKDKYTQLLDNVFMDCDRKECYTVEEQVSCLLRHCTDPRILSVIRSGWEPWV